MEKQIPFNSIEGKVFEMLNKLVICKYVENIIRAKKNILKLKSQFGIENIIIVCDLSSFFLNSKEMLN